MEKTLNSTSLAASAAEPCGDDFFEQLAFTHSVMPAQWMHCFNGGCPQHGGCLRYITGSHVGGDTTSGPAVYPSAAVAAACPHYKQARVVRAAWGFDRLFALVRRADGKEMREQVKRMLGGHGSYYAYHHGERVLMPEQQQAVLQFFRRRGYTEGLAFDHYDRRVDFA